MRTNIVIDDELMEEALALSNGATKRAIVEEALRKYVQLRQQAKMRDLFGKVQWEGDIDEMRRNA